jgi:hypothetical protein
MLLQTTTTTGGTATNPTAGELWVTADFNMVGSIQDASSTDRRKSQASMALPPAAGACEWFVML